MRYTASENLRSKMTESQLVRLTSTAGLAGARTEGRAPSEGAGAHAEARAEGRRNIAQEFAAAGAAAFASKRSSGISTKPVTAGFAQRIDTLHREAGQVLHFLSPEAASSVDQGATNCSQHLKTLELPLAARTICEKRPGYAPQKFAGLMLREKCSTQTNLMAGRVPRATCGVKRKGY